METENQFDQATIAVHQGTRQDPLTGGVNTPISVSTSTNFIDNDDISYPRMGSTPNHRAVTEKLAALERCEDGLLFSSGMGAVSALFLGLLSAGDHVIVQQHIYGGSYFFIASDLQRFGIEVSLVDSFKAEDFAQEIRPTTKLIYIETPSNPLLHIVDLEGIVSIAREHQVLTAIDNTFATPIMQRPATWGIDIVLHSGTKYLTGHSDIMFGALLSTSQIIDKLSPTAVNLGATINTQALYIVERSLKTLALRVERQNDNALAIARFLENCACVRKTYYPGLETCEGFQLATRQMDGYGAVVTFELESFIDPLRMMKNLKIIKPAVSLGGIESTVSAPHLTSHVKMTSEERAAIGISDSLVRLSVGIEGVEDLMEDIRQAVKKAEA